MPSFYIDFSDTTSDIEVSCEEFHHISHVFRHKKHDVIALVNGKGLKAKAAIKDITKKSLILEINELIHVQKPARKVACAFSLLKNKNDLLIVEKLTELGVSDLFPLQTKNSVKLSKENTKDKMIKTAISAIKQCDNAWLPNIHDVMNLETVLAKIGESGYTPFVASEMIPEQTLYSALSSPKDVCIIIGPEGGFDTSEFALFNQRSIQQVSISINILRAETAAICAVSQAMAINTFVIARSL